MPQPQFKYSTAIELKSSINAYTIWLASTEVTPNKKEILAPILSYLTVLSEAWFTFHRNPNRIAICANIFARANLPDLYFAKYVKDQLAEITEINSSLRDKTQYIVSTSFKLLMSPYLVEVGAASGGIASLGVTMRASGLIGDTTTAMLLGVAATSYVFSEYITELRIGRVLNNHLYAEQMRSLGHDPHILAPLGDGLTIQCIN